MPVDSPTVPAWAKSQVALFVPDLDSVSFPEPPTVASLRTPRCCPGDPAATWTWSPFLNATVGGLEVPCHRSGDPAATARSSCSSRIRRTAHSSIEIGSSESPLMDGCIFSTFFFKDNFTISPKTRQYRGPKQSIMTSVE